MSEQSFYTLAEAAALLGRSENTLDRLLHDLGIDLAARLPKTISRDELDRVSEMAQRLKMAEDEG